MKPIAVKLEDSERERLAALAGAKNRTPHFLMREAICEYLDREESRLAFVAAAEASYQQYKETGMHVTMAEFSQWVEKVALHPTAIPPACHD
jgi:predicted transcriptional regulator